MSAGSYQALCYGKLPGFGDFVRYNASGPELQMMDRWLQEGLHMAQMRLQSTWDAVYKFAPTYHFLFPVEQAALLGVMQPSYDKAGRKYPFFTALKIGFSQFTPPNNELAPILFEPYFAKALRAISSAKNGTDSREITQYIEESGKFDWQEMTRERENHESFLWKTTQDEFWGQTLANAAQRRLLLFKNVTEIFAPFRPDARENLSRLRYGLRFPLSRHKDNAAHSAALWLQVCARLLGNSALLPFMFWTKPDEQRDGKLFLFFRQPTAQSFLKLMQPDAESDAVFDLEREGDLTDKPSGQFTALLGLSELKLSEFLRELRIIGR